MPTQAVLLTEETFELNTLETISLFFRFLSTYCLFYSCLNAALVRKPQGNMTFGYSTRTK